MVLETSWPTIPWKNIGTPNFDGNPFVHTISNIIITKTTTTTTTNCFKKANHKNGTKK
jgi:hypothetical protein